MAAGLHQVKQSANLIMRELKMGLDKLNQVIELPNNQQSSPSLSELPKKTQNYLHIAAKIQKALVEIKSLHEQLPRAHSFLGNNALLTGSGSPLAKQSPSPKDNKTPNTISNPMRSTV